MRTLMLLSIICLFVSCSPNLPEKKFPPKEKAVGISKEKVDMLAANNSEFAWDLYKKLNSSDKNLFFSPYSISTALAMTYAGAKNNTAKEMEQTLNFPGQETHQVFSALIDDIQAENPNYKLSIANALWGQKGYAFSPEFLKTTGKNYGAGLYEVDFAKKSEEARKTINKWVEYQTQEKIKDLFLKGTIDASTRLILTNAIYFKADWKNQFEKSDTRNDSFHLNKTKEIKVPMMFQDENSFFHYQGKDFQVLRLPYKGDNLAMLIFLPKEIEGLAKLEKQLDAKKIAEINKKMVKKDDVVLLLPKFKATYKFEVNETLKSLGMKDAFDEAKADFSGMTSKEKLYIDKVIHKAFVNVDEKGTEAAAATAVKMRPTSARANLVRFLVKHPFLFTISHIKNGSVLFMGRIVDPSK